MSNLQESSSSNSLNLDQMQEPMQLQQLQQLVFTLVQQVQQHQTVLHKLEALNNTIQALQSENQALADENQKLRAQLSVSQVAQDRSSVSLSPSSVQNQPTFATVAASATRKSGNSGGRAASGATSSLKKRVAAARAFKTAATQGPQGFEYVYLGRNRKLDRNEVRSRLRRAGVDTGRVLDVCFPASGVIGILLHTQYVAKFTEIMTKAEAEFIKDFEPLHPDHLADPKFISFSDSARADEMAKIVHSRSLNTLAFVRPVLVPSVGRSFVDLGWIDDSDLQDAVKKAHHRLAAQDPKKAAFVFRSTGSLSSPDGDVSDESDTEMSL